MRNTTELVIFDWDGTLIDSAGEIVSAMQGAIAKLGFPQRSYEQISRLIGLGLVEAFDRLFPELGEEALEQLVDHYRQLFGTTPRVYGTPFPGAETLLDGLHQDGFTLAVATGKSRRGLDRALEHTGWSSRFALSRCADETASKPDPLMLDQILTHAAVEPGCAVMIGDTTYDMEMARRAGVPAIGVAWGVHEVDELRDAGAHAVASSPEELAAAVRGGGA